MEKRKKNYKKMFCSVLSAVVLVCIMTFMPGRDMKVMAQAEIRNLNIGFAGINLPTSTDGAATAWGGTKIYYGCDTTDSKNLWYVINPSTGFLFSSDVVTQRIYDDNSQNWDTSDIKAWLNGSDYKNNSAVFTAKESAAIDGDVVLLTEPEAVKPEYGFGSDRTRLKSSPWWLRTSAPGGIIGVANDGSVYLPGSPENFNAGICPAFHLNVSSVLFTSAITASKSSSFSTMSASSVSDTWKLTLKGTEATLNAAKTAGDTILQVGYVAEPLTISHSAATTLPEATQVSAALTDSNGTILYYGKINDSTSAMTSSITIPAGLAVGDYNLYVFAEDVNGGNKTDYASALGTAIPIRIQTEPVAYDVSISSGSNMTKTSSSGAASQSGLTGAMTNVVYNANDGYYFPTDYSVTSVNGISVSRDNYNQITVSGTPSATTALTLTAATAKAQQSAPAGLSDGVDKISGTTTSMEYASSADATSWNVCTDNSTAVAAGTWYVRYKETDTKKAGTAASVAVTASTNPPILYQVTVNNGTGDGNFAKDTTVTITADTAASGKIFDKWMVVSGGITLADTTSTTTTFTMPTNMVEVTATYKDEQSHQNSAYKITKGDGKHQLNTNGSMTVTCDGALDKLTGIYVDDKLVAPSNYTLKKGSTILTLNADYLNTLSAGTHTLRFQYNDGYANEMLTISSPATGAGTSSRVDNQSNQASASNTSTNTSTALQKDDVPKTGDKSNILMYWLLGVAIISGSGMVYFGRKKKLR